MNNAITFTSAMRAAGALLLAGSHLVGTQAFADSDVSIEWHATPVVTCFPLVECSGRLGENRGPDGELMQSDTQYMNVTAGRELQHLCSGYAELDEDQSAYTSMNMRVGELLFMNTATPELMFWQNRIEAKYFTYDSRMDPSSGVELDSSSRSTSWMMVEQIKVMRIHLDGFKRVVFDAGVDSQYTSYTPDWVQEQPIGSTSVNAILSGGHSSAGGARIEVDNETIWSDAPTLHGAEAIH